MAAEELSGAAAQARKQAMADQVEAEQDAPPEQVSTAFMVFIRQDGQIVLTHDLNVPIIVGRPPTHDEIYGTLSVILKDISGQQVAAMAAQGVLQLQQQLMQQAGMQQGAQDVLQRLAAEQNHK